MEYQQSYLKLSTKPNQFEAVFGLSLEGFEVLSSVFTLDLEVYFMQYNMLGELRKRKLVKRKDNVLSDPKDKLCFILMYLKNNSLQESHASAWGMTQPQCNLWIHFLLQRLLASLKGMNLVPSSSSEELDALLGKVEELYLDTTERPIQRALHPEEQKRHYSGKKKTHHKT